MGGATRIVVSATEIDPNAQREEPRHSRNATSCADACDRHAGVTDSLLRTVRNKIYSVFGWRRRGRSFEAGGRPR
jgi:hypothetical protein